MDDERSSAFGNTQFDEDEHRQVAELLSRKLAKEELASRPGPGGQSLTYVEGYRAIERANYIFRFDGWSSSITSITLDFTDHVGNSWAVGVSAIVRVTLKNGAFHEDVGFGEGKNSSRGAAIEKAKKEAVTDATKRALRLYGNALGNSVYDKAHLKDVKTGVFKGEALDMSRSPPPRAEKRARPSPPSAPTFTTPSASSTPSTPSTPSVSSAPSTPSTASSIASNGSNPPPYSPASPVAPHSITSLSSTSSTGSSISAPLSVSGLGQPYRNLSNQYSYPYQASPAASSSVPPSSAASNGSTFQQSASSMPVPINSSAPMTANTSNQPRGVPNGPQKFVVESSSSSASTPPARPPNPVNSYNNRSNVNNSSNSTLSNSPSFPASIISPAGSMSYGNRGQKRDASSLQNSHLPAQPQSSMNSYQPPSYRAPPQYQQQMQQQQRPPQPNQIQQQSPQQPPQQRPQQQQLPQPQQSVPSQQSQTQGTTGVASKTQELTRSLSHNKYLGEDLSDLLEMDDHDIQLSAQSVQDKSLASSNSGNSAGNTPAPSVKAS